MPMKFNETREDQLATMTAKAYLLAMAIIVVGLFVL